MIRYLFLLACLVLVIGQAAAQALPGTSQPTAPTTALPGPFTTTDTIRAIHNLFRSRRHTGNWLVGGSAAVTAIAGLGTLADNNGKGHGGYYSPNAAEASLLIGIGTAPAWIVGFAVLTRFNAKKERAVLTKYEQTGTLPRYVQRRLSARSFNTNYRLKAKS